MDVYDGIYMEVGEPCLQFPHIIYKNFMQTLLKNWRVLKLYPLLEGINLLK